MKQVMYFSAKWCAACDRTSPIIDDLKSQNIKVIKVDTDYEVSLTEKYNVRSVPTTIVFENGNEVRRYSGALTTTQLNQLING